MTNADQVIKAGQFTFWQDLHAGVAMWWWMGIVILFLVGIMIAVLEYRFDIRDVFNEPSTRGWMVIIGGFLMLFGTVMFGADNGDVNLKENWKNTVAIPYINSLPEQKSEIIYIKLEPQIQYNSMYWLRQFDSTKLTPLTISFKSNGVETYTSWYDAHMDLTDQAQPYIEYQRLPISLDDSLPAGIYNPKVYLPSSYEFTDIK